MRRDLLYVAGPGAIGLSTVASVSGTIDTRILLVTRMTLRNSILTLWRCGGVSIRLGLNLSHRTARCDLRSPVLKLLSCPIIHGFVNFGCHGLLENRICRL